VGEHGDGEAAGDHGGVVGLVHLRGVVGDFHVLDVQAVFGPVLEPLVDVVALVTNTVISTMPWTSPRSSVSSWRRDWEIDSEDLAHVSPYLTEHIKRFGEYSTHELGIEPEAYDPKLDIDFAPLREQDLTTVGFTDAA